MKTHRNRVWRGFWLVLLALGAQVAWGQAPQASADDNLPPEIKQARKLNSEGKQEEALAIYQRVLASSPDSYDAHLGSGIALDLQGRYSEARQHLSKAIAVAPEDKKAQALRTMAMSYAFEGNASEAARFEQQLFDQRLAKQEFVDAGEIGNELARVYLESGDIDKAEEWYRKGHDTAVRAPLKDSDKDLWEFRWEHAQARIAARRGKKDEAQKHVTAAKALLDKGSNPEQARFFPYLSGYVALYGGDAKTAISELQKADQRDPFILLLLAQANEKAGNQAQAMELYRKILEVNNHNPTNAFARPVAKKKLAGK